MKNTVLRGKLDMENSHVRFEVGNIASAKPRRGSLFYKKVLPVLGIVFLSFGVKAGYYVTTNDCVKYEYDHDWYGDYHYADIDRIFLLDGFSGHLSIPETLDGYPVEMETIYYICKNHDEARQYVTSLTIPNTVNRFTRWNGFEYWTNLTSIVYNPTNGCFCSVEGVLYLNRRKYDAVHCDYEYDSSNYRMGDLVLLAYPCAKSDKTYRIPDGVVEFIPETWGWHEWDEKLGDYYFSAVFGVNPYLTTLEIPSSCKNVSLRDLHDYWYPVPFPNLKTIRWNLAAIPDGSKVWPESVETLILTGTGDMPTDFFQYWPSLREVIIEGNVTAIPACAFRKCMRLERVVLPNGLTEIGSAAFADCLCLTTVTIPKSVKTIGRYAFTHTATGLNENSDFNAALDCNAQTFKTDGSYPWYVDTDMKSIGDAALRAGMIENGEKSTLSVKVAVSGVLSFWCKTSSEENHDYLVVSVNGTVKKRFSGEKAWSRVEISVKAGDSVTWSYEKDAVGSVGQDTVWLDLVTFPGTVIEQDAVSLVAKLFKGKHWERSSCDQLAARLDAEILAAPRDWKLRIYRAAYTLAIALDDKRLRTLFEKSGYKLNWSDIFDWEDLKAKGVFSLKNLPTTDEALDEIAEVLLPAFESAQEDLDAIPETWEGSFVLEASVLPMLSSDVRVDCGDVAIAKAALAGARATFDYVCAQSLNVDYSKLPVTEKGSVTENFQNDPISYNPDRLAYTEDSLARQDVIREDKHTSITVDGKCFDWTNLLSAGIEAKAHEEYFYYDWPEWGAHPKFHKCRVEWLKCFRKGKDLYIALKYDGKDRKEADDLCELSCSITTPQGDILTFPLIQSYLALSGCFTNNLTNLLGSLRTKGACPYWDDATDEVRFYGETPVLFSAVSISGNDEFMEMKFTANELAKVDVSSKIVVDFWRTLDLTGWPDWDDAGVWRLRVAEGDGFCVTGSSVTLEPIIKNILADHPACLSKIRDTEKLVTAKKYSREAMRLMVFADNVIVARKDGEMHFFEYDPVYTSEQESLRQQFGRVQKSLDSAQPFTYEKDGVRGFVDVFLGGIFDSRGITRNLLPTFTSSNTVQLTTMRDPTFRGIVPEMTINMWDSLLASTGRAEFDPEAYEERESSGGDGDEDDPSGEDDEEDGISGIYARGSEIEPIEVSLPGVGSSAVYKVTGLPTGLKYAAGVIHGKPMKSGIYTVTVSASDSGKVVASESYSVIVRGADEYILSVNYNEKLGRVVGAGVYTAGRKVTLKATGIKGTGTQDGTVFTGWFKDAELIEELDTVTDCRTSSISYEMPEADTCLWASFSAKVEDSTITFGCENTWEIDTKTDNPTFDLALVSASLPQVTARGLPTGIKLVGTTLVVTDVSKLKPGTKVVTLDAVNQSKAKAASFKLTIVVPNLSCSVLLGLDPSLNAYPLVVGTKVPSDLIDCTSEAGWSVKVTGLPSGLSFKNNVISGIPKKAGVFTVTFTASKQGVANKTATITLDVASLPEMVTGSFDGAIGLYVGNDLTAYGDCTLSVSATGKISAKVVIPGSTYTFAADAFDEVVDDCYAVSLITRKGDATLNLVFDANADWPGFAINPDDDNNQFSMSAASAEIFRVWAYRNDHGKSGRIISDSEVLTQIEQVKSLKSLYLSVSKIDENNWKLVPSGKLSADLTVAFKSDGKVSLSGKLIGNKISGSTILVPDSAGYVRIEMQTVYAKTQLADVILLFTPMDNDPDAIEVVSGLNLLGTLSLRNLP